MKYGFLLVDKPEGPSSHGVVAQVRRELGERKIGHLGTLDPAASGLMVLAVGSKALKVVELFEDLPKQYIAQITLGAVSSTYDREGILEQVEPKAGWSEPDQMNIQSVIEDFFLGDLSQVPPAHSAVHIDGQRAYKLARAGKLVEPPTRQVEITECIIKHYEFPVIELLVSCSSGTYIRSLAHDLGQKLHCGAYLGALRRTKVGEWSSDFAVPPDAIGWSHIIPLREVLAPFPSVDLTEEESKKVMQGQSIDRQIRPDTIAWNEDRPIAIMIPRKDGSNTSRARKVFG